MQEPAATGPASRVTKHPRASKMVQTWTREKHIITLDGREESEAALRGKGTRMMPRWRPALRKLGQNARRARLPHPRQKLLVVVGECAARVACQSVTASDGQPAAHSSISNGCPYHCSALPDALHTSRPSRERGHHHVPALLATRRPREATRDRPSVFLPTTPSGRASLDLP